MSTGTPVQFTFDADERNVPSKDSPIAELLVESDPSAIAEAANVHVRLGALEDGLPLVLSIQREKNVRDGLLRALGVSCITHLPEEVKPHLMALEETVAATRTSVGCEEVDGDLLYLSQQRVERNLVGELVGHAAQSAVLNEHGMNYEAAKKWHDSKTCTALEVKRGGRALTLRTFADGQRVVEPLQLESFSCLPTARFQVDVEAASRGRYGGYGAGGGAGDEGRPCYEGILSDTARYHAALRRGRGAARIVLSRHDFVEHVILPVAAFVHDKYHAKGQVHTLVAPSTIRLTPEGIVVDDQSASCESGAMSAAFFPSSASPEQKLGFPVETSSDVYAIGQLLLKVFKGASLYGEIKQFVVPGSEATVSLLAVAGCYIPVLEGEARKSYERFVMRCCSYEKKDRFATARELHHELSALLATHPLHSLGSFSLILPHSAAFAQCAPDAPVEIARRVVDLRSQFC